MEFRELIRHVCERPGMWVGRPDFRAVCIFFDGFDLARDHGPVSGFRELLVVRLNEGDNRHWSDLASHWLSRDTGVTGDQHEEQNRIARLGRLIEEYLQYRDTNGITKVPYEYGQLLLRKRWYHGPLRKKPSGQQD
jgi:hypothetical protein